MNEIGSSYFSGRGVQKNAVEALGWYTMAAERGHVFAMCNVGYMYGFGKGIPQSDVKSFEWYERAATAGNAHAMYQVGVSYLNGEGVDKNRSEAVRWFQESAEGGEEDARLALDTLDGRHHGHQDRREFMDSDTFRKLVIGGLALLGTAIIADELFDSAGGQSYGGGSICPSCGGSGDHWTEVVDHSNGGSWTSRQYAGPCRTCGGAGYVE
jgi:hypothetical protein